MPRIHSAVSQVVGARIRELRSDLGISQADLADMSGLHVANLGKIERGLSNPSLATVSRIAAALDTSLADVVRDVQSEHIPETDRLISASDLIAARRTSESTL